MYSYFLVSFMASLDIWAMSASQWQALPGVKRLSQEVTDVHALQPEHAAQHWSQGAVRTMLSGISDPPGPYCLLTLNSDHEAMDLLMIPQCPLEFFIAINEL